MERRAKMKARTNISKNIMNISKNSKGKSQKYFKNFLILTLTFDF
ncbi:hypothetical protein CANDROIZ_120009 [Candidatus Roizmanbacteria bacterium]|nr:hypothetical protein CANDROIZ_120009 [Candidatus Roizmanbacteria bacterium]